MKKIILLIIGLSILTLGIIFNKQTNSKKDAEEAIESAEMTDQEMAMLKEINKEYGYINTLSAKLKISLVANNGNLPLTGEIHFKRPNQMRLIIKSHDETIIDVGSNDTNFWYYLGTSSENVYYGNTDNVKYYSMPLNPYWISQGFGMQDLELTGKFFRDLELKNGDKVTLYVSKLGKFVKSLEFDDHFKYLTTCKIYDENNKEVFSFYNSLPTNKTKLPLVAGISFVDESEFIWIVSDHTINNPIPDSMWVMPDKKKVFIR
jgi:outer membrane lipoprotein-sorting protein